MRESAVCFHNLEWPPDGARLAGPTAWLRGWIVGKPGHDFIDVRVRHAGGTHLGVLGLPRTDLAAHFKSARSWLPAEFILGVPVADGPLVFTLEAMDDLGAWHALQVVSLTVSSDGQPSPRVEGRVETRPAGSWTLRDAHHPFHGHLDAPGSAPLLHDGRVAVFGWLLDETQPLAAVLATTDGLVFNHLAHSRTDEALAAKIVHPGARKARLRGAVDFPATAASPACLRVYAVAPDGNVTLCFAQRVQPGTVAPHELPSVTLTAPPPALILPALPSGRPRRLLFVLRSLYPNDATLRALDLAHHLVASYRWSVRIVTTEDGPLRQDFEMAGIESLVVNPGPLLAATGSVGTTQALAALERDIRWDHLDAVVIFDALCSWAITVARQRKIPTLFDCSTTVPLAPDPTADPAVQDLQRAGWRAVDRVCFASATAARVAEYAIAGRPAVIIPQWHTPGLLPVAGTDPVALAPLRTVDWLVRHHPAAAALWNFRQGPAGNVDEDELARQDDAFHPRIIEHTADWNVRGIALCLGPLFARGPLRPVIDAAAAGIPVVAPCQALTEEIFTGTRIPLVDATNPQALAHALLAWAALPDTLQREAAAVAPAFRAARDPAVLLPQWEQLLSTLIARHG